jgi:CubicO group peptidase (beta-lactamase class C family)
MLMTAARLLATTVALTLLTAAAATAPAHAADDTTTKVAAYLRQHRTDNDIPGLAAAVVHRDRVIQQHTLGATGDGAPVTPQTPFLLGSVSKPFTALAVMQLAEAGQVDVDAPVRRYLPSFRLADETVSERITVRQLLNHTSGIPEVATRGLTDRFDNTPGGLARSVRDLSAIHPTAAPGSTHQYSDANYMILGALVETLTGRTFADHLRRTVLDPLDMRDTAATAAEANRIGLPAGHRTSFGRPQRYDPPFDTAGVPYGYLAASLTDLSHFMLAQLNAGSYGKSQLLAPDTLARMHTGTAPISSGGHYALGWRDTKLTGTNTRIVWHAGATPGYFAHVLLVPASDLAVIVLANRYHPASDPPLASAAFDIARIMQGTAADPAPADPALRWAAPALLAMGGLLLVVLATTLLRERLRHQRRQPYRRRDFLRNTAWIIGGALLAVAAAWALPRLLGGGSLATVMLWTPDLGHAAVAVACLATAVALARAGFTAAALLRRHRSGSSGM